MTAGVEFHPASAADLAEIKALLAGAGLPFEDLDAGRLQDFIVLRDGNGALVAAGGLERHGRDALLRSVVVSGTARGRGLGKAVTEALEARARRSGIATLYLLTTTAADFFPRLGFDVFDRAAVPAAIAGTTEFATMCPASAVCLRKVLQA